MTFFRSIFIVVIILTYGVFVYSLDDNMAWLPLQQIATTSSSGIGVDSDENGVIDHTDADLNEIVSNGNETDIGIKVGNIISESSIIGNDLSITGTVSLPPGSISHSMISTTGCSDGQVLKLGGSSWMCANDNSGSSLWSVSGSDIYYNAGNVGIGTSNPQSRLHVTGNIILSKSQLVIDRPDTTGGWARGIMYYPTNTYSGTELGGIGMMGVSTSVNKIYIAIGDNPWDSTRTITLTASGNVGIGTTSPSEKLMVSGGNVYVESADPAIRLVNTADSGEWFQISHSGGWARLSTSSDNIYTNRMFRADGGFQVDNKLAISGTNSIHSAQYVDNTHYGYFEVRRSDGQRGAYFGYGSPGNYVNLFVDNGNDLYIGGTGNVGIGTNSPSQKLTVNGNILATGSVSANAFYYTSDVRFKENISEISDALEKVTSLQGVKFNWKNNNKRDIGLIAQDVEKVIPEVVGTNKDGIKSVEYGNLVAVLIEAIKEQQKEIDSLKEEIRLLKNSSD